MASEPTPAEDLAELIESARRLGVDIEEAEALQWLTAMAAGQGGEEMVFDIESGVFGHRLTMLDFSPGDLARFRRIGELVELPDRPGVVETALALSGSAAQSKIQTYPGDCDYFQRVNIRTATREEACLLLGEMVRHKALGTEAGPSHRLTEVKLGSYPSNLSREGRLLTAGSPISWSPQDVRAGRIEGTGPDGMPTEIAWEEAARAPGWVKLDWVIADPKRRRVASASNMLDVTWEAPDGTITPLDGFLDPYFQEVYLEAESIPIFSKLARQMSDDALDEYVDRLEEEVRKYLTKDLNYGKAAKRMYNVFRLTGRYQEAAFLRELFDEPATVLYQVWALIRTLDEAAEVGSLIPVEIMVAQTDELIMAVIGALEGDAEAEIVRYLLRLRDSLAEGGEDPARSGEVTATRQAVINLVNNFFYDKLTGLPEIRAYMDEAGEAQEPDG